MEVLLCLVQQQGEVVSREQIAEKIWGKDVYLDTDNGINGAIRKIRKVLKDDPEQPRFIQTITGKGYRFIAPITGPVVEDQTDLDPEPEAMAVAAPRVREDPSAVVTGQRVLAISICAIVMVLLAGIGVYFRWFEFQAHPRGAGGRTMLAVLPFENLTGDAGQEYFSDGMTEEMITELGRLDPEHLGVIGRSSVMRYKQNPKPLDQIGPELGVQYVLEGSVRRDSGTVRITAQLIQVKDQTHVWARQYDRELKNLLALQAEIAQEVTDEITLVLGDRRSVTAANHSAVGRAATSYEAYDLYLEGRYFWNQRTEAGFKQAIEYFEQAIAKDPNYAPAYAGLADTFGLVSTWYMAPQGEFMPKARAAALKALELDDSLAEAHTSLALVAENYDYDWRTAEKEFRRAIQLNPDYPTAHQWYAECLAWQGRFEEAFAEIERARRLDPMSLIIASDSSKILYYSRQYDRAITESRTVSDMLGTAYGNGVVCASHIQQGKFAEALKEIQGPDDDASVWAMRAYVYGRWHQEKQLQHALAKFEQLAPKLGLSRTSAYLTAYAGSDRAKEQDKVLALLQEAYLERSPALTQIKVDPKYDPLRSHPRFQELFRKVGLTDERRKDEK